MQVKHVGRPIKYSDEEFEKYLKKCNLTYLCVRHYVRAICKIREHGVDLLDSYAVRAHVRGNNEAISMYDVPAYNHYVDFLLKVKKIARPHIDKRRRPENFKNLHWLLQTYTHLLRYMQENMDVTFNEVRNMTYAQQITPTPEGTKGAFHLTEPVRVGLLTHIDYDSDWGRGWEEMARHFGEHHKLKFGEPPEALREHYLFSDVDNVRNPLSYDDWFAIIDTSKISLRQYHKKVTEGSNTSPVETGGEATIL